MTHTAGPISIQQAIQQVAHHFLQLINMKLIILNLWICCCSASQCTKQMVFDMGGDLFKEGKWLRKINK